MCDPSKVDEGDFAEVPEGVVPHEDSDCAVDDVLSHDEGARRGKGGVATDVDAVRDVHGAIVFCCTR
eukprot:14650489-Heterocapsa_arctica.AAC.1